jgi:hypothetical protein
MVRRSFRVGLRVGLLVGEFGRCELATDMGDGTWKITVPALHADSDSLDLDRLNESMAGIVAIDAEGCLGQEPGDRERAPVWCSSRKTWVTTTTTRMRMMTSEYWSNRCDQLGRPTGSQRNIKAAYRTAAFSQQGRCISPIEPFRDGHA